MKDHPTGTKLLRVSNRSTNDMTAPGITRRSKIQLEGSIGEWTRFGGASTHSYRSQVAQRENRNNRIPGGEADIRRKRYYERQLLRRTADLAIQFDTCTTGCRAPTQCWLGDIHVATVKFCVSMAF